MDISRRDFLRLCAASAAALGLGAGDIARLEAAITAAMPKIIWLHGSGCQGDSISFLNRFDGSAPPGQKSVDDILINSVDLAFHSVLMASAAGKAVDLAQRTADSGKYILVAEGAVPTAFRGKACNLWLNKGKEVTYQKAISDMAKNAQAVLCIGTCASYGGISAAGENPTKAISVGQAIKRTGKSVINIPGCPAHPDWITWVFVQLILGNKIELDKSNRPKALFGNSGVDDETLNVHENCPRNGNDLATAFGQDNKCLEDMGCRGPNTFADCPIRKWNNGENWCVDCNGMCIGCVEPNFPGGKFYL